VVVDDDHSGGALLLVGEVGVVGADARHRGGIRPIPEQADDRLPGLNRNRRPQRPDCRRPQLACRLRRPPSALDHAPQVWAQLDRVNCHIPRVGPTGQPRCPAPLLHPGTNQVLAADSYNVIVGPHPAFIATFLLTGN
jgi:hypothetical protein